MRRYSFLLLFALSLSWSGIVSAGEVRTITLENGLDLVMMPDASSPLLSSLLIVRVGSSYETLANAGATHLLEHMLFRGTKTRTQGEIYDAMDMMGAYYNAQTNKTYTNYILVVPREQAREGMEIQADMVLNSIVPADTFEVEKGRVIAEIEQNFNRSSYPAELAHLRDLYGDTPYAFPTLGSVNGIRAISRDAVVKFHDDWYAVNNITLVLRGDASFSEMEDLARKVYGDLPARELPERPESWPVGFDGWQAGKLHVVYGDVGNGTMTVSFPAPAFDEVDYPGYSIILDYLDDRLDDELRGGGNSLVTYVYSGLTEDPDFSVLDVTAGLMPGTAPEDVLDGILEAVKGLSRMQFTNEMIQRTLESMRRDELFFAEQVQYGSFLLAPKLALAPYGFWEDFEARRSNVRAEDATDIAMNWFSDPYFVATAYLPGNDGETLQGVTLGEVVSDTLENGLVVITRQVGGAPVAGIHIIAKDRALLEGDSHRGWADLLHRLLTRGTDEIDKQELQTEMDDIGMEISAVDDPRVPMDNYRTTPEYGFVRVQVVADRWVAALKLLGRLFESPRLFPEDIEAVTSEQKGIVDRGNNKVSRLAGERFKKRLYGDNILAKSVYGTEETLAEVDTESLEELRNVYFAPNNLVISILSSAPPEETIEMVKTVFGGLASSEALYPVSPPPKSDPGLEEITGKGRQGYLASGFLLPKVADEDVASLRVANAMVADLIYRDLGEKRGWAYGAGSSITFRPGWAAWSVSMGLPEEHLEESRKQVYKHLARIARGDFDSHRMEVARQSLLGKTLRRYSSRINLAMALGRDAVLFNDPLYTWEQYDNLKNVTLEQVKKAARRYLDSPGGIVTVYGKPIPEQGSEQKMPAGMMGGMMGH